MIKVALGLLCFLAVVASARSAIWTVDACAACRAMQSGTWAPGGCSGLVSILLGKPRKATRDYVQGNQISSATLEVGDIVGWKPTGGKKYGHVAIYINYGCCNCKYVEAQLNVAADGGYAVCRNHDYGRTLYHMGY